MAAKTAKTSLQTLQRNIAAKTSPLPFVRNMTAAKHHCKTLQRNIAAKTSPLSELIAISISNREMLQSTISNSISNSISNGESTISNLFNGCFLSAS
jgi:hypothetical protein